MKIEKLRNNQVSIDKALANLSPNQIKLLRNHFINEALDKADAIFDQMPEAKEGYQKDRSNVSYRDIKENLIRAVIAYRRSN